MSRTPNPGETVCIGHKRPRKDSPATQGRGILFVLDSTDYGLRGWAFWAHQDQPEWVQAVKHVTDAAAYDSCWWT